MKQEISDSDFKKIQEVMFGRGKTLADKKPHYEEFVKILGIEGMPWIHRDTHNIICAVLGYHRAMRVVRAQGLQEGDRILYMDKPATLKRIRVHTGSERVPGRNTLVVHIDSHAKPQALSNGLLLDSIKKIS